MKGAGHAYGTPDPRGRVSARLRQELLGWIFPRLAELPAVQREDALNSQIECYRKNREPAKTTP